MQDSLLISTDVYKWGHMEQYPDGTSKVYSYICARSSKKTNYIVWFGLQYYIKEYLMRDLWRKDLEEFLMYRELMLGKTPERVKEKVERLVNLGYLPLEIKAVPEGTVIENRNILASIECTNSEFFWVVGYFESLLLKVWNTCSVATLSFRFKQLVSRLAAQTSDSEFLVPFQVHDFGYRGCSSEETAKVSGAAHLINFLGTDTVLAVKMLVDYYNADITKPIGLSVPASEHSVMCAFGRDRELEAVRNMLRLYPEGVVSIVSDTYDFWNVITNFTRELKEEILARNGKVVFRPDSGDPMKILCGDPDAPIDTPQYKGAIRILDEVFGSSINSKGYRELNPKVGLIYGDGMYYERFETILNKIVSMGYASTTLVIGIGGLLLQQHNRDDYGFAFKATFAIINGQEVELFKDPITDPGKRSHKGRMKLVKEQGKYKTLDQVSEKEKEEGELITVFKDGKLLKDWTLTEIRERLEYENSSRNF